ncbi:lambda exonuclease family protein [Pseudomonas putida]|uniref:YqaJ-like recombinase protein n=1 Tax=Pseudomonas putida TaxID=303 RepID=A0A9X8HLU0_PSEPU|nr:lambda exonuclease family protein [Pseudomonas putida]ROQ53616.1 YqaJ-like recombinase protein [Pseudomonas putida]
MILIECEQGSAEWHRARAGCITASMFGVARSRTGGLDEKQQAYVTAILAGSPEAEARAAAGYKTAPRAESIHRALEGKPVGQPTEAALNYAFNLAVERIAGKALDNGFETWQMKRGHELEPMARMEHEMQTGLIVQRAGFVTTDDGAFGASADGLIGEDGGSEYKCFIAPDKLRAFHIDNDASGIMDQVQGCMWITGRKFWHVGMYCPALEAVGRQLWWAEFKRDDDYIEQLEVDLWQFKLLVDDFEAKLRSKAA